MTRYVVFTDLDGTLLDHDTYDYSEALLGLSVLKRTNIPLVFCSSKTRSEQEVLRRVLDISHPFIVEDGGAVYIEKEYFHFAVDASYDKDDFHVLAFGLPYEKIRETVKRVARTLGIAVKGYGDVTPADIAEATGLSIEAATRAKAREFEETLLSSLTPRETKRLEAALQPFDLTLSRGGRFYAVKGKNDKGAAARALVALYARGQEPVTTVGVGDSYNDLPLLSVVDIPILVQRPDHRWQSIALSNIKHVEGVGPVGWSRAMEALFSNEAHGCSPKNEL